MPSRPAERTGPAKEIFTPLNRKTVNNTPHNTMVSFSSTSPRLQSILRPIVRVNGSALDSERGKNYESRSD